MKRSRGGFSLTELLTVVAILTILMAVATPAAVAISRNLKMRELDDTAREIFLASQNTLTARKADGTLSTPEGTPAEGQDGWYWLFDADTDFLLSDGAMEPVVAENHIAIWYNAESAMVAEVYYGEKSGSFTSPGCDWDKESIQNKRYSDGTQDTGSLRAGKRIGYYDGDGTNLEWGAVEQLLPPLLEIVNGDELTVKVTVPKAGEYWAKGVTLTVTVEELDGSGVPTGKTAEFNGLTYSTENRRYELVLDSLTEESRQFKNVCRTISPGANIRVTAKLSAPEKSRTKYLSASAWKETNSLFETRTGDTVSVACARHLQNLENGFSNFSCESAVNIKQTKRIDWPAGYTFQSIGNDCFASYHGGKLEIRGLNGGLFDSTAENMELTGIRIVNPAISGGDYAGALANTVQKAQIDDCWVYATTLNPEALGNQTENFIALKTDYFIKGGTVGGLIGSATNCDITNSFAALSEVSGTTTGGLIGSASGCTITNCYATAENLSGSVWSAMFVGNMSNGTITRCYAAGNITSTGGAVSGFANGSGTFSGSYCAVSYNKKDGTTTGLNPQYGFAAGTVGACAYLAVNTPANANSAASRSYEELKSWGSGWKTLSAAQSHPYRAELDGKAYPFPGLGMPHYGSWPMASQPAPTPDPDSGNSEPGNPEPGDVTYDKTLETKITEVEVKQGTNQEFYIYAGPDGTIDSDSIQIENNRVFSKNGIKISKGEDGWYQIVVTPKESSGGNKDGWETNMSITITINDGSNKTVTVKLIFKAKDST